MSSVIWAKTDAGRREMRTGALVKERATRNLLLVIDGTKSEALLSSQLAGIGHDDFLALAALGLIAPGGTASSPPAPAPGVPTPGAAAPSAPAAVAPAEPLDYAQFTTALTHIIARQLGLRGFMLTLALEKAGTAAELQSVARRTLEQLRERKGDEAFVAARRTLYGE